MARSGEINESGGMRFARPAARSFFITPAASAASACMWVFAVMIIYFALPHTLG